MNTRIGNLDNSLRKAISVSLVVATYAGSAALDSGAHAAEETINQSLEMIQTAVAGDDVEARYWLFISHIEGPISGADNDYGVELLTTSAGRGDRDAERMYTFLDHAFSGEGC